MPAADCMCKINVCNSPRSKAASLYSTARAQNARLSLTKYLILGDLPNFISKILN